MSAPRSILFCLFSHNVWGGIETWLREILAAHREDGWDVTLALARGKRFNDPQRFARVGQALSLSGQAESLSYMEIDGRTGTAEGRIAAVQRIVQRVSPSIVLPLALGHALPAIGRAKLAGTPCRFVHALHAINAPLLRDAESFAEVTDLVVGVNALQTKYLRRAYPPERLKFIPNGTWRTGASPVRTGEGACPPSSIRLVFAGRIDQNAKRVLDIVALSLELRRRGIPFRYTVAGDGPSLPLLRDSIAQHQLDEIELLGYVDPARLHDEIYPASDVITVFSEIGESFVLVAIDAMINGCVLVTSEWPGVHGAGYLREGENGFAFPPGDVAKAADAIEAVRSRFETMSRNAIETARHFTWTRTRAQWLDAMHALLEREPVVSARFPMSERSASGRLDRLPGGLAERLRRAFHRYPDFADGWGEWPGTLSHVPPDEERAMLAELRQLDAV